MKASGLSIRTCIGNSNEWYVFRDVASLVSFFDKCLCSVVELKCNIPESFCSQIARLSNHDALVRNCRARIMYSIHGDVLSAPKEELSIKEQEASSSSDPFPNFLTG